MGLAGPGMEKEGEIQGCTTYVRSGVNCASYIYPFVTICVNKRGVRIIFLINI